MAAADAPDRRDDAKKQRKDGEPLVEETPREEQPPAAGPHATEDLSNPSATPGAGALQTPGAKDDMGSTG
jgi:hypothetical protein